MGGNGRMIVVGLDGVNLATARRWAHEGALPCLGRLLEEGHLVDAHDDTLPGSHWVNLATGVGPGRHGWVHTRQLKSGTYETFQAGARDIHAPPFYEELSRAGLRCAVIDWPGDRPRAGFNGMQVIDWGTEFKLSRFATHPRRYRKELLERIGLHPLTHHERTDTSRPALRRLAADLVRGVEMKSRLVSDLLAEEHWDFLFVAFGEPHKAGHFFWEFQDRAHPRFDDSDEVLGQALRRNYASVDRALTALVSQLGRDDDLVLVSDRGMQPDLRGDHLLEQVLQRLGLYRPLPSPGSAQGGAALPVHASADGRGASRVRRMAQGLPPRLRALCKRALQRPQVDWAHTRAFRLPTVGNSYIRLNVRGREPQGVIASGAEYEAVLRSLERELHALVNPATGEPAVAGVSFPAKRFPGPYQAELPDIAVAWRSDADVTALRSPSIGTVSAAAPRSRRSANHNGSAFMLLHGASFAPGPSHSRGDLRQLAPTVLRRFGIDAPRHYELPALTHLMQGAAAAPLARAG